MKILPVILSLLIGVSHGQEAKFPDITKSFKNAKLISTTEIDPFNKVLSFGSDDTSEVLKTQLLATLGEGWAESKKKEPTRPKPKIAGLKNPPPAKLVSEDNTILLSGEYPDTKVRLTVFKDPIFKDKILYPARNRAKEDPEEGQLNSCPSPPAS